jgi:hypothetical protein
MTDTASQSSRPPKLSAAADGRPTASSLADLVEWFLNFDERAARMRHPMVEELFRWKQADDREAGIETYPFESAEGRFAIGVVQAIETNDSEPLLKLWISDVLSALSAARETKAEITATYQLDSDPMLSPLERSAKLTTNSDRRAYLTACWFDALFTAEVRVLGWIYQEMFGKPFQPN